MTRISLKAILIQDLMTYTLVILEVARVFLAMKLRYFTSQF